MLLSVSKPFSTALISSILTFTLTVGLTPFIRQNTAVAQSNTVTVDKEGNNGIKQQCTDAQVLVQQIADLNIRVSIGLNYIDFTKYYTDLVISLNSLKTVKNCQDITKQFETVISNYALARSMWKWSFRQQFIHIDNFIAVDVLRDHPNLTRYGNGLFIDDVIKVYLQRAVDEYNKIQI